MEFKKTQGEWRYFNKNKYKGIPFEDCFLGRRYIYIINIIKGKLTDNKLTRKNTSKINIFSYIKQIVFNKSDMYPLFQEKINIAFIYYTVTLTQIYKTWTNVKNHNSD